MKKSEIRVAAGYLSGRIYAGRVNKKGTEFLAGKVDVTNDALKAVIDHITPGHILTLNVEGVPAFEIEVRVIAGKQEKVDENT